MAVTLFRDFVAVIGFEPSFKEWIGGANWSLIWNRPSFPRWRFLPDMFEEHLGRVLLVSVFHLAIMVRLARPK